MITYRPAASVEPQSQHALYEGFVCMNPISSQGNEHMGNKKNRLLADCSYKSPEETRPEMISFAVSAQSLGFSLRPNCWFIKRQI